MLALRSIQCRIGGRTANVLNCIVENVRHSSCGPKLIRRDCVKNLLLESEESPTVVEVNGWARKVQMQKRTSFVHIDDGTSINRLQVVVPNAVLLNRKLSNGQALKIRGKVVKSRGSEQSMELLCSSLDIVGDCSPEEYTINHIKSLDTDFLREKIHLRPRVRYFQAVNRVRSEAMLAIQMFMSQNSFFQANTPMVTANDCEGGGECFSIQSTNYREYFGRKSYLTVSGQLHLEALAASLMKVWNFGPVFRAEKSMSPKHLSEFLMLEAEECFLTKLDPLLDRVETLIKFIAIFLEQRCSDDLKHIRDQNNAFQCFDLEQRFKRITYKDAIEMLKHTDEFYDKEITHLNSQMEQRIVKLMGKVPVFVTHFPADQKPFYMKTITDSIENLPDKQARGNELALCFDLLLPIVGEVAGGSLREDCLAKLEDRIRKTHSDGALEQLDWYLDLRRFGHAPSGGFGLGFDRLVQALTGTPNIKDVVPFPRWPYHCYL